jgi:hypothetical protein
MKKPYLMSDSIMSVPAARLFVISSSGSLFIPSKARDPYLIRELDENEKAEAGCATGKVLPTKN